jgi:hypothetical protein
MFQGYNIAGDYSSSLVYIIDWNNYTDNGAPITRTRTAPHISKEMNRILYNSITFEVATGVSGQNAPLSTIQVSYSDDGGFSWSPPRYLTLGQYAGYSTFVRTRRLGWGRNRVWKLVYNQPTHYAIFGAAIDVIVQDGVS